MKGVDEAGNVERGENGEYFFVVVGCYLLDLEALGYYILVGYHDLFPLSSIYFQDEILHTAFGSPVVPELKLRNPQSSPFVLSFGNRYAGT